MLEQLLLRFKKHMIEGKEPKPVLLSRSIGRMYVLNLMVFMITAFCNCI